MTQITGTSKGSGYYDLFLSDNTVARVQDGQLPSGYVPTAGDDFADGEQPKFIPAAMVQAKKAKRAADKAALAAAQAAEASAAATVTQDATS